MLRACEQKFTISLPALAFYLALLNRRKTHVKLMEQRTVAFSFHGPFISQ